MANLKNQIGGGIINPSATTGSKKARVQTARSRKLDQARRVYEEQLLQRIAGLTGTVSEIDQNVDDLITLSGVAENSTDLGTFTGDVLTDNITVKAALQEIETALEGHLPVIVEVHNQTGSDLDKGKAVYVSGTHTSGKPTVVLADANGAGTYPAIGLVFEDILAGEDGFVIISGFLDGIDTDTPGWNAGEALYVDTTPGELTTTRPTATSTKVQKVALVARRHATAGSVILIGAGRTNDIPNELVTLTGVALNDSDLGTFTGGIITANSSIKTALQELETDVVEAKKGERFSEYRVTTAVNINAAPPYQFTFNVAHVEDTNITTRTTANTRIEIQEDGVYRFDFRSTYRSNTAFVGLFVYISINGVITKYGGAEGLVGGPSAAFSSSNGSHMEQLSSGDYVEMFITRHASASAATYAHSDHTYIRVVKMGDAR